MDNAIVIVVDRLGAGYLGPYGNTWIETPSCNRLAARSVLFEFALADAVDLPTVYRSYWQGLHAMSPDRPIRSLPEIAAARGVHGGLVTDEPQLVELPGAAGFADRVVLTLAPVERPAAEVVQTQMAQLFAAAAHWLQRAPEPFLLWIHARGMAGAWDAPVEFRNQFADEDDPRAAGIWSPRPSSDSARRSIRMKCWATCTPMRGKSRCWTTAWELSWRRPRRRRAGNGRCWP